MKSILKAYRDALVASGTLTALVPAANIYAGLREEKTIIPAIDIFQVSEVVTKLSGAKVGGESISSVVMQVSIFHTSEDDAQTVADAVRDVLLGDNATLNTAGIRNVGLTSQTSLAEAGLSHIPQRYKCNYMYTV